MFERMDGLAAVQGLDALVDGTRQVIAIVETLFQDESQHGLRCAYGFAGAFSQAAHLCLGKQGLPDHLNAPAGGRVK